MLAILIFGFFSFSLAAHIPPEIRVLPTPLNFALRLVRDNESTWVAAGFRNVDAKQALTLEAHRVKSFSKSAHWVKLLTSSGQHIQLYKDSASATTLSVEIKTETPLKEAVEAVVAAFGQPTKTYCSLVVKNFINEGLTEENRLLPVLRGISSSQLKIERVEGKAYANIGLTEDLLLQLIRGTSAEEVSFEHNIDSWKLSNSFYRDSVVKQAQELSLDGIQQNEITDESLLALSAHTLKLGNATAITASAIRRFLQPVLEAKAVERSVDLTTTFPVKLETLFEGYQLKKGSEPGRWTVEGPILTRRVTLLHSSDADSDLFKLSAKDI